MYHNNVIVGANALTVGTVLEKLIVFVDIINIDSIKLVY